jgi:hypothetical protein
MRADLEHEDDSARTLRLQVEAHIDQELQAAGVDWADVPRKPNTWGPSIKKQCDAVGQAWVYDTLFASHSNYVHPTWHEIRAFHLTTQHGSLELDVTYGTMTPVAVYVVAQVVAQSCGDAAAYLPCDLEPDDTADRVASTIEASQVLAMDFSEFQARMGWRQT